MKVLVLLQGCIFGELPVGLGFVSFDTDSCETFFVVKIRQQKLMEVNLNFYTKNVAQWFIYHSFL